MTDDESVKAEEKVVESETTQVAPPTTEVPTTEEQTTIEVSDDQGTATENSSVEDTMTEEQRRAFQEMRIENKRLKEERLASRGSAFDVFRGTAPAGQLVRVEDYTDTITGETNWNAYNQALFAQATQQASLTAKQTTNELIDENNARTKFPELFADEETEQEIADRWFAAKMRGENPSVLEIASRVAKRYGKAVSKAEKIGAEKVLTEVAEKEKAGLTATGQTPSAAKLEESSENYEQLISGTRHGDDDAITARISKIPWANK